MRWVLTVLTMLLFALLSACGNLSSSSTTVISAELPSTNAPGAPKPRKASVEPDYGAAPGESAKAAIQQYMRRAQDENYTAQYRYVNVPVKGSHGGWTDTPVAYGYVMCVWTSARTSDGGYAGEQLNFFLIKNDAVVRAALNANWLCKPYMQ
jgi:hypothetical protein